MRFVMYGSWVFAGGAWVLGLLGATADVYGHPTEAGRFYACAAMMLGWAVLFHLWGA